MELRRLRDHVGIMRVGGNKKGAFTRDRQPKARRTTCAPAGARTFDRANIASSMIEGPIAGGDCWCLTDKISSLPLRRNGKEAI